MNKRQNFRLGLKKKVTVLHKHYSLVNFGLKISVTELVSCTLYNYSGLFWPARQRAKKTLCEGSLEKHNHFLQIILGVLTSSSCIIVEAMLVSMFKKLKSTCCTLPLHACVTRYTTQARLAETARCAKNNMTSFRTTKIVYYNWLSRFCGLLEFPLILSCIVMDI